MDYNKIHWRSATELLGMKSLAASQVVDAAFEFEAPHWCDLRHADTNNLTFDEMHETDLWFAQPHPLLEPKEPTPPAEALIDPSDYSPYKSPAAHALNKVSPGSHRAVMSARKLAAAGLKKPTSPVAINSLLHSTPMKLANGTMNTPKKLLSDSAGKARLALRTKTPGSASKMQTGAQRVISNHVVHKMQFDTIDEASTNTLPAAPAAASAAIPSTIIPSSLSLFSPDRKPKAKRVSMTYVPPPATHVTAPLVSQPPTLSASLFVSSNVYSKSHNDENAPPTAAVAPTTTTTSAIIPTKTTRRTAAFKSTTAVATAATTTTATTGRKRRSNEAVLVDLDPELEAMLAQHNKTIAAEQAQDHELAQMLAAHNKNLQANHLLKSPPLAGHKKTSPPGSGNKQPKKKMRFVASKTNSGLNDSTHNNTSPPSVSTVVPRPSRKSVVAVTTLAASKKSSSKSLALNGSLSSRSMRKSIASTITASTFNSHSPSALNLSHSSSSSALNHSASNFGVGNASANNSFDMADVNLNGNSSQTDISFNVEDLGLPAVSKGLRKSMGKALRAPIASVPAEDDDESEAEAVTDVPMHDDSLGLGNVNPHEEEDADHMLSNLIELEPAPASPTIVSSQAPISMAPVAVIRRAADVKFTAAVVTKTAAPTSRTTSAAAKRKSVGTVLTNRTNTVPTSNVRSTTTISKVAASVSTMKKSVTAATVTTTTKPSTVNAVQASKKTSVVSSSAVLTSRNKYILQSTAVQAASSLLSEDDEIAALLSAHNNQFKPKVRYVPRAHSTADIKKWETVHGKKWHELNSEERERANMQITAMLTQSS